MDQPGVSVDSGPPSQSPIPTSYVNVVPDVPIGIVETPVSYQVPDVPIGIVETPVSYQVPDVLVAESLSQQDISYPSVEGITTPASPSPGNSGNIAELSQPVGAKTSLATEVPPPLPDILLASSYEETPVPATSNSPFYVPITRRPLAAAGTKPGVPLEERDRSLDRPPPTPVKPPLSLPPVNDPLPPLKPGQLVIVPHLANIIRTIINPQVAITLVESPPGSGKSIGIPVALSQSNRVMVAVPTIAAARSLFDYVARNFPGHSVGYAVEGYVQYKEDTRLVYVTYGHLRRKVMNLFRNETVAPWEFTDVLMLDEIHLGSLDATVAMSLWLAARRSGRQVPRMVCTTATPPTPQMTEQGPIWEICGVRPQEEGVIVSHYRVVQTPHHIDTHYTPLAGAPHGLPVQLSRALLQEFAGLVASCLAQAPTANIVHTPVGQPPVTITRQGDVLVFLPGAAEVKNLATTVSTLVQHAEVLQVYSALGREALEAVLNPGQRRRVILGTNMLESAVTIPGVTVVVDSLLEKHDAANELHVGKRLAIGFIAQDSANQRRGRAGRLEPGVCYRLLPEVDFIRLPERRTPEVQRVSLHGLLLEYVANGHQAANFPRFIKGVTPAQQESAVNYLLRLGALQEVETQTIPPVREVVVSDPGAAVANWPLDVRNGLVLLYWLRQGYQPTLGAIIVSLIDSYGPSYFAPDEERGGLLTIGQLPKFAGPTGVHCCLRIWEEFYTRFRSAEAGEGQRPAVEAWCNSERLNFTKIWSWNRNLNRLFNVLKGLQIPVTQGRIGPNADILVYQMLRPILLLVYGDVLATKLSPERGSKPRKNKPPNYRLDDGKQATIWGKDFPLPQPIVYDQQIIVLSAVQQSSQNKKGKERTTTAITLWL
jgi:HrpA-like RNA helicase